MGPPEPFGPASRPALARGVRLRHDPVRGATVLLSPERVLVLGPTAEAVLALCDGVRTLDAVVGALTTRFEGSPEVVRAESRALLERLARRGVVVDAAERRVS